MKRFFPVLLVVFLLTLAFIFVPRKFTLSSEYYHHAEIIPVTVSELSDLIAQKKSFLVFVSQPDCRSAESFKNIIINFQNDYPVQIFQTDFSDLKTSGLAPEVKFYPSFLIYHDGELTDFLDANSDDDTAAYTTKDGLAAWLSSYLNLEP